MEKVTTAKRLSEIMIERHITQKELLELCQPWCNKYGMKMGKSEICRYLKGEYLPKQDKLTILGLALDVREDWLMGYDVPKSRNKTNIIYDKTFEKIKQLDLFDLGKVDTYVDGLLNQSKYQEQQDGANETLFDDGQFSYHC